MKEYTFTVTVEKKGTIRFSSQNKGFNAFELLGFLERKKLDIMAQITETLSQK